MSITVNSSIDFVSEYAREYILRAQNQPTGNYLGAMANTPGMNKTSKNSMMDLISDLVNSIINKGPEKPDLNQAQSSPNKKLIRSNSLGTLNCERESASISVSQRILGSFIENGFCKINQEEKLLKLLLQSLPKLTNFILNAETGLRKPKGEFLGGNALVGSQLSALERPENHLEGQNHVVAHSFNPKQNQQVVSIEEHYRPGILEESFGEDSSATSSESPSVSIAAKCWELRQTGSPQPRIVLAESIGISSESSLSGDSLIH